MALLFAQLMAFHKGDFQIFFFVLLIVAHLQIVTPTCNPECLYSIRHHFLELLHHIVAGTVRYLVKLCAVPYLIWI